MKAQSTILIIKLQELRQNMKPHDFWYSSSDFNRDHSEQKTDVLPVCQPALYTCVQNCLSKRNTSVTQHFTIIRNMTIILKQGTSAVKPHIPLSPQTKMHPTLAKTNPQVGCQQIYTRTSWKWLVRCPRCSRPSEMLNGVIFQQSNPWVQTVKKQKQPNNSENHLNISTSWSGLQQDCCHSTTIFNLVDSC